MSPRISWKPVCQPSLSDMKMLSNSVLFENLWPQIKCRLWGLKGENPRAAQLNVTTVDKICQVASSLLRGTVTTEMISVQSIMETYHPTQIENVTNKKLKPVCQPNPLDLKMLLQLFKYVQVKSNFISYRQWCNDLTNLLRKLNTGYKWLM